MTTTDSASQPTHLDPSELGTKAYWNAAYTTEFANYTSSAAADEGTIWFSDAGAEERMLTFLEDLADEGELSKTGARCLDLGTGNGHLLFALREEGWEGELVGVDYAEESVRLAREIKAGRGEGFEDVLFEEWDILGQEPGDWLKSGFELVLDKGTFDAVCLAQDTDEQGRRVCEGYRKRVEPLLVQGGRLLITSCNWTEDELKSWFGGSDLEFEGKVKYPSFTFGGKSGSSVVTLCFKKM